MDIVICESAARDEYSAAHLDLAAVRRIAIQEGFVFQGIAAAAPDSKRANLAGLFEHYKVNCLSAFRSLQLRNQAALTPGRRITPAQQRQSERHEQYSGSTEGGVRHGVGVMEYQAGRARARYEGQFVKGAREGLGIISVDDGSKYAGSLRGDLMWGPGVFHFAPPRDVCSAHRTQFEGLFNGRPRGRGVMTWGDGAQDHGDFDGTKLVSPADTAEAVAPCEAAVEAARECAAAAMQVQRQAQQQAAACYTRKSAAMP